MLRFLLVHNKICRKSSQNCERNTSHDWSLLFPTVVACYADFAEVAQITTCEARVRLCARFPLTQDAGKDGDQRVLLAVHQSVEVSTEPKAVSELCQLGSPRSTREPSATRRPIGKISAKCCSFSAVSAPIFARE